MNTGPLNKLRVLEFCQVAAGPFCGMLLADMGADVIKIEPPQGDSMRAWPPISQGYSENFASLNRNKRSIALNLKDPEDNATARNLILQADVVIENNRPGVMDRLGLGYASLKDERPDLIYCSISAFGQTGPRAKDGAYDLTMQAASGIMGVTGEENMAPVKAGVPVSDFATGLYAAFCVSNLLHQVREKGRGGHIDASMLGASLGIAALQTSEYFGSGVDPVKLGAAHPRNAPYEAFKAKDGYFALAAGNDKLWASVCRVLNLETLITDKRFDSTKQRAANQTVLKRILEEHFTSENVDKWVTLFRAVDVPCEPIQNYSQTLSEPQVEHMQWAQELTLPNGVKTRTFGFPIGITGLNTQIRRMPPNLNEHREEIISELSSSQYSNSHQ